MQKTFRHGQKLSLLATCAILAACGGGGGSNEGGRLQFINFSYPGGGMLTDPPVKLKATSSSGLPVSFQSTTPDFCTVSGDQVTLVKEGECRVVASQAGGVGADGTQWAPADDISQLFKVLKKTQLIAFAPPDYVLSSVSNTVKLSASSSSGLPVTFTADTPANCSITGDQLKLMGKGTCAVTATQAGDDHYAPLSVQRFVAVDPLVLADGFSQTNGTGAGSTNQMLTAQGGGVTVNPWSSLLGTNAWQWCAADRPDWCYHTLSADGKTLTSGLEIPKEKLPAGWHDSWNKIDIFAPGKTAFASNGDTTGGLRVTTETALGFTMGIPQGLYTASKPVVVFLDLGKRNGSCNVELATLVWPRMAGVVGYSVPLSNFAVTNNCGIAGVTATSLNDNVRKLPSPWDGTGAATNLDAFNKALDGFKDARTSATTLMKTSDIVRMRVQLLDVNTKEIVGNFASSSIAISGAITIQ